MRPCESLSTDVTASVSRAGCLNWARPVRRAGCGNGAWFDTKALAIERASNRYANLNHRATSRLYVRREKAQCFSRCNSYPAKGRSSR
jgi:hypothetical protein